MAANYRLVELKRKESSLGNLDDSSELLTSVNVLKLKSEQTFFKELVILIHRNITLLKRDRPLLKAIAIQTFVYIGLFGIIYFRLGYDQADIQNRFGLLFILAINIMFNNVMHIIVVFPFLKSITVRERYSCSYRVTSFYASHFAVLLPTRVVAVTVLWGSLYWICALNPLLSRFLIFLTILYFETICSIALALLIGSASPSISISQIIAPVVIVLFMIFGGNFVNNATISWILRWIQYISLIFFGFGAFVQNEFIGETFTCAEDAVSCIRNGEDVVKQYSITIGIWESVGALAGLSVVFLILGCLTLKRSTKPKINIF